jgi:hypothetical protein
MGRVYIEIATLNTKENQIIVACHFHALLLLAVSSLLSLPAARPGFM